MTTLFLQIAGLSLSVTPILLLFMLLLPRMRARQSPRLRCILWLAVSLRLLLPLHLPLQSLFPVLMVDTPNLLGEIDPHAVAAALASLEGTGPERALIRLSPLFTLTVIWGAGVLLFLLWQWGAYRSQCRNLRRWSSPVTDPAILALYREAAKIHDPTGRVALYQSSRTGIPLLLGLLRPRIYLPAALPEGAVLPHIFAHELTHHRRKDLWHKLLLLLVAALHWYNPLVHWMNRQAQLDLELACDETLLLGSSATQRQCYGAAILSFLAVRPQSTTTLTTYFYGGYEQMKLRFTQILTPASQKAGRVTLVLGALLLALSSGWMSRPALAAPTPDATAAVSTPTDDVLPAGESSSLPADTAALAWPVPGYYTISSPYGWRFNGQDFHTGMDIVGEEILGKSTVAADDGTILHVETLPVPGAGYGKYIIIDHGDGLTTLYGHLDETLVVPGQQVERGQEIGKVGSTGGATGPNLHFEVRQDGLTTDPAPFLAATEAVPQ